MAADPWQHQIPVVLRGRVDCEIRGDDQGWSFTDPAGDAVVVHGTDLELWRLLALTAGTTLDAAGEWSPDGFRPSTIVTDGRMVVL